MKGSLLKSEPELRFMKSVRKDGQSITTDAQSFNRYPPFTGSADRWGTMIPTAKSARPDN